jgi:hypothetical protein
MPQKPDEYDIIADALAAVRLVRGHHASSTAAAERIDEIADMLRGRANAISSPGVPDRPSNALALSVADAIAKTYGTK